MKILLLISLFFLFSNLLALQPIRESAREIPVAYTVDVVVCGGNLAGVAAAITAANLGAEVLIITSRPSFSHEISDKSRYWLEPGEVPASGIQQELLGVQGDASGYSFITPGPYKKRVEEALINAGVKFLFWSTAVGVIEDGSGNTAGIVMANKAGRQIVKAKVIIDATSMAGVVQMAGGEMTDWPAGSLAVSCTKMVLGNDAEGMPIVNYIASTTDFLREYTMQFPFTNGSWVERCAAEYEIRQKYKRPDAAWMSHMIHLNEPNSIVAVATDNSQPWTGAANVDLDCFRPVGIPRMYVASGVAAVSRTNSEKLIRPIELITLGERIGTQAKSDADAIISSSMANIKVSTGTEFKPGLDVSEDLGGHRPYHTYTYLQQEATDIPVWGEYDVIVVGGGSAGAPAAIAAVRSGAKVLVIDMLGILGGVGTNGIGHNYDGYQNGFGKEYPIAWWKSVNKAEWLFDEIAKHGGEVWFNTLATGTVMEGNRVRGVVVATPMGRGAVTGTVIIDATGDGDISFWAGAEVMHLNNGDLAIQEASYLGDEAAPAGLRNEWGSIFFDPADIEFSTNFHYLSRKYGAHKNRFDFYGLVGNRETRMVVGDYVVTALDQKIGRTYPDMINVAKTHIYDTHGVTDGPTTNAGLLPSGINYVPYRSLLPRGLTGILVTGRCKSMTHDAMPLARMQWDLTNEGYAVGYIAAKCVNDGVALRDVDINAVQDHLASIENMSTAHRTTACVEMAGVTDSELQIAVQDLSDTSNFEKILREPQRSIPFLRASFADAPTKDKAQALCTIGDTSAVEYLANWFDNQPLGLGIAYDDLIPTPPMPAINATIWALGQSKDLRAVPALAQKLDTISMPTPWPSNPSVFVSPFGSYNFSHVRSLLLAMGKIGDPSGAPALKRFLERTSSAYNVRGNVMGFLEWQASSKKEMVNGIVELLAASAIYKCGDIDNIGRNVLVDYRDNDWRGVLVRYAGFILSGDSSVSTTKIETALPEDFGMVVSAYPNPFNPAIKISIATGKALSGKTVQVEVYDMKGSRIEKLNTQRLSMHKDHNSLALSWDATKRASGMYIIKTTVGNQTSIKRVTLIR